MYVKTDKFIDCAGSGLGLQLQHAMSMAISCEEQQTPSDLSTVLDGRQQQMTTGLLTTGASHLKMFYLERTNPIWRNSGKQGVKQKPKVASVVNKWSK